jgi:asparagine synthase (glutamine-hydrolysing)
MCGICGFVGRGELADVQNMNDAMAYRGPDGQAVWQSEDKPVFFGHRRLAIIDIAGGWQPMWTEDESLGIVFNGEIYNHLQIRKELQSKGHTFQTSCDTEVLLYAYREWGSFFVNRLNGMWTFAIYDKKAGKLFCSRDRFGQKPFYYSLMKGTFGFASELKSLTKHQNIDTKTKKLSLKKYFAYGYIPAPNTIYEQVYKLPAGHNLTLNINDLSYKTEQYWDFVHEPFEIKQNSEKEWTEELVALLEQAVKRRLMSDVPLGVFLSGGVDSSAVLALASRHVPKSELKSFSMGFNEAGFDETHHAKKVAQLFYSQHFVEKLSIEKALDILPFIVQNLDEPMGDSSILPTYLLSQMTRKNVTVALGGDGADELFGGYEPFKVLRKLELYDKFIPKPVHESIRFMLDFVPSGNKKMTKNWSFKAKRTLRGLSYPQNTWFSNWLGTLGAEEINELFAEETAIEELYSEAIEYWDKCKGMNLSDKITYLYIKMYMQDDILTKVDRASMLNSLEVRTPFLDIDFINFARRIPHQYKYRNGETKYLLKKALEQILPEDILYRQKEGFSVPISKWFSEGRIPLTFPTQKTPFNTNFVKKYYQEHQNHQAEHYSFLWNYCLLNDSF